MFYLSGEKNKNTLTSSVALQGPVESLLIVLFSERVKYAILNFRWGKGASLTNHCNHYFIISFLRNVYACPTLNDPRLMYCFLLFYFIKIVSKNTVSSSIGSESDSLPSSFVVCGFDVAPARSVRWPPLIRPTALPGESTTTQHPMVLRLSRMQMKLTKG